MTREEAKQKAIWNLAKGLEHSDHMLRVFAVIDELFDQIEKDSETVKKAAEILLRSDEFDFTGVRIESDDIVAQYDCIGTAGERCTFLNVYKGDNKVGLIDVDSFDVDAEYEIIVVRKD